MSEGSLCGFFITFHHSRVLSRHEAGFYGAVIHAGNPGSFGSSPELACAKSPEALRHLNQF
jgi:hypothetical protein